MFYTKLLIATILLPVLLIPTVSADGNDWVDVNYIARQQKNPNRDTSAAQSSIIRAAGITASKGPWTVQTPEDRLPPSKNRNDYLSFAPYYWPDCNWCPSKRDTPERSLDNLQPTSEPLVAQASATSTADSLEQREVIEDARYHEEVLAMGVPLPPQSLLDSAPDLNPDSPPSAPSSQPSAQSMSATSSEKVVTGTLDPAQARAKTQKTSKCTPSPTKSMAPTATWTSCPYTNRDGQANPDTRHSAGPGAMNGMSQSVIYNAIAYSITGTPSYSEKAVSFIDTFFLSQATAMTPHANFGQVIRGIGPEHLKGTFTGVLDMRGMVKVANAILALKSARSPHWDSKKDAAMKAWMAKYVKWMETDEVPKKTARSANNHASFFYSQLAAVKLVAGDVAGARDALNYFFTTQFLDHIAESGEQPFEAVRTKPFHYRCFNIEALITAAKIGDSIGLDFWTAKTRSGATIQTAVDFVMRINHGSEPVENALPHVAAIAAAYGDPGGKYSSYLQAHKRDYKNERYWFYDQTSALNKSPAARQKRDTLQRDATDTSSMPSTTDTSDDVKTTQPSQNQTASSEGITFQCPAAFDAAVEVELDNGVFVTCDQLKPFYVLFYPDS